MWSRRIVSAPNTNSAARRHYFEPFLLSCEMSLGIGEHEKHALAIPPDENNGHNREPSELNSIYIIFYGQHHRGKCKLLLGIAWNLLWLNYSCVQKENKFNLVRGFSKLFLDNFLLRDSMIDFQGKFQ